jgi:hypothetical protein
VTLLEKLKALFNRDEIPDEAKLIFDSAKTPADLLRGLDELLTRNEVEAKELNEEITKTEMLAQDEEDKVRTGNLPERQKRQALLHVKRLRKQMDNYEGRLRIYERNMNLHLNLIGKIQQMEAMKLGGVDESRIDQIVMDFEEKLEKYADIMNAAEAHEAKSTVVSAREERELRDLEDEITGRKKEKTRASEPGEAGLKAKSRELRAKTEVGTDVPAPEPDRAERGRRKPIDEMVEDALGEEDAARAASRDKKRVELE